MNQMTAEKSIRKQIGRLKPKKPQTQCVWQQYNASCYELRPTIVTQTGFRNIIVNRHAIAIQPKRHLFTLVWSQSRRLFDALVSERPRVAELPI